MLKKKEIVERFRIIRKDVLKLSQSQFADELGSSQALVSRMELEGSGTIDFFVDILNYFQQKGIKINSLFGSNFNINHLTEDDNNKQRDEICQEVDNVRLSLDKIKELAHCV